MRLGYLLTAVSIACVVLRLQAQSGPQQPSPTFRAGVDVVQFDVSVLDRNRQPVKGLTAADFTVLEDGKLQPIVAFDAVDIPDAVEPSAPWMRDAPADVVTNDTGTRRLIVIVFDDAHIPLDATRMAQHIARDVVDRLGPSDLAAVTFTDSGRRQDITGDRQRLLSAIDSLVPHPSGPPPGAKLGLKAENGSAGSVRGYPSGGCAFRGKFRSNAACVIDTLVTAGEALRSAPQGRKTLVYISAGVPFDFSMTDLRGENNPGDEGVAIQEVLKTLQEANVNLYAVDPSGLTAEGIIGPRLDSLRMFAEDTGGRATIATNAPWDAVPQIFRENSSYYMLGIRTSGSADRPFHRIQVKVDRPDVEVRARPGYFAPPPAGPKAAAAGSSPLEKALGQAVPGGALPLGITVAPFATAGDRLASLAIAVALREPLQASSRALQIAVMALDSDCGECKKLPWQRQTVVLPPGTPAGPRAEVLSRLRLPVGSYEIRVAATLDGRAGGVFAHVEIPDFRKDRLSASGLILGTTAAVLTVHKDLLADVIPMVPTTVRDFGSDQQATAFLRLYQSGTKAAEAVHVTARIRDSRDAINFEETTTVDAARFGGSRSADYRLPLPLSRLERGPHLLTLEAKMGELIVRRDSRFVVR